MLLNCGVEKTLESPLDRKEMKPGNSKGNQSWIFNGRTDSKAETPTLWPPNAKSWPTGKDPDAGKDWRQEKGTTEDEMVGWHHWLDGREFEKAPGVGDGQGGLACCSSWGCKELDTTEKLNRLPIYSLTLSPPHNHVCFLHLFCKEVRLYHCLDSTYKWYHMIFIFVWLTCLCMIISRSIHIGAHCIISFFMAE